VANTKLKTEEDDIITTTIQEYDETLTSVGVCTRTQGSIKQEDLNHIAEFGP
jgi:hypothetical protein